VIQLKKIKIPQYAKDNAQKGLNGSGYGTNSGRNRARYLKSRKRMPVNTAEKIRNFLKRFHGMAEGSGYSDNITGALNLWGGQPDKRFLEYLNRKLD